MRPPRRRTAALGTAALITAVLALCAEMRSVPQPVSVSEPRVPIRAAAAPDRDKAGDRVRHQAFCRTRIDGSRATANCQNPNPVPDVVRLHIECDRWWDLDSDSAPVEVLPAGYVEIANRCWKEIRSVWVSHEPVA